MPAYQNVALLFATGVTLTTSTDTIIIDSGRVAVSMPTMHAVVTATFNVTIGTGTVNVLSRIRRGSGFGSQLQFSNPSATPGATTDFHIAWSEQILNAESVEYTLTIQQASGSGTGTVNWALLRVDLING